MNCKTADIHMMKYAEKTIEAAEAKNLVKHLLGCKNCRESFVYFDTFLDDAPADKAPDDFTACVMAKVSRQKAAVALRKRVLAGLAAVFSGIALLFAYLRESGQGFTDSVIEAAGGIGYSLYSFIESIRLSLSASSSFGLFTFLFVPVLSLVLFVVHNSEKNAEA